ncbi:hypothetical protein DRQ33_04920, partial [bacterium]
EAWDDGSVVEVCIGYVEDSLGNSLASPYCWDFVMDKSAPVMVFNFPGDGSIFPMQWVGLFEGHFVDTLSGVDTSSFWVSFCEDTFEYPRAGISVSAGDSSGSLRFTVDPNVLLPDASWRSCSLVCMGIGDMPDYCGPNDSVYCWSYELTPGPLAEIITPQAGEITACADQCILIHLWDEDLPVDTLSIELIINDDTLDFGSGLLSYSGETLSYCPPESLWWSNEEVVSVVLETALDSVGAYLQDTLEWEFPVDLESPIIADIVPGVGDTISYGTPPICFDMTDNLSGVNWDSLEIAIDGSVFVGIDTPGVEVSGVSVCFYPDSFGLRWFGGDSVVVCVHSIDSPDLCAPNVLDTCWRFYIQPGGPYGSVEHPFMGAWVSCEDTGVVMHLLDEDGVVDSTIEISIYRSESGETDTITYPDPSLSWDSGTGVLIYHSPVGFSSAETVEVCILYAEDPIGNPLSPRPVCSHFYMDRHTPVLLDEVPMAGEIVYTRHPWISFNIIDSLSGLDPATVELYLNGVSYGGACLDYSELGDGIYEFIVDSTCYEYAGCDTIEVRVSITDTTDYCEDNILDTSWVFSVDCQGPRAEEIYVPPDLVSSCDEDSIVIWLWDSLPGVDTSTVVLYVSGYDTIYWGDPNLTYSADTLVYYPSPALPEEGAITVRLLSADDLLGNELETELEWTFYLDRIAPIAMDWVPGCGDTIANTHPDISIVPYDSGCGLMLDSAIITVNGTDYSYSDGWLTYLGGELIFDPDADSLRFPGGSSILVCWHLVDCADDICPPNTVDTCCTFYVESGGPWSEIEGPCETDWIGCAQETISIYFEDEDGIIPESIEFEVCFGPSCDSCETLDVSASGVINYHEYADSITFDYIIELPISLPSDGWNVCANVLYAMDSLGNDIFDHGHIDSFYVMLDYSAPEVSSYSPIADDTIDIANPEICVQLADVHSGIDIPTISLIINGVEYSDGDIGFSWDGSSACFDADEAGIWWTGGSVVDVCVNAFDNNCACPNELDSCWYFVITPGGPVAIIEHPQPGIVSACQGESIAVILTDPQDDNIIDTTITISVWRSTVMGTTVINYGSDPQLEWNESSHRLVFYPQPALAEGETVYFCVLSAIDTLENPMEDTVCVEFSMDLAAFVAHSFTPADDETVSTRTPTISLVAMDTITGIADSSVILTVDGNEYTLDIPALYWINDTTLVFIPESLGIQWQGGDCFEISLYAYDQPTPGYCEPNDSTVSWNVCIAPGGPIGTIIRPFDGAYSSCEDEHIIMTITDSDGVDSSSIRLVVEGDTFSIDDPEIQFGNDTLYFFPSPPFYDGQQVDVCLIAANDMLGNELEQQVCWYFIMDMSPPWSELDEPTADMVRDRQQDIVITVGDQISGADSNSITIWVNSIQYNFREFPWTNIDSINGGILRFIPEMFDITFPPGESVCVDIQLTDSTDYCPDNLHYSTYCFFVEPEVSCLVHPNPFTPNNDNVNEIAVFDYPYMFSENAQLQIYDLRNVMVFHKDIQAITDITRFIQRAWDGNDHNGNPLPEGLYVWIIISNGEVVCNGTVVLAR